MSASRCLSGGDPQEAEARFREILLSSRVAVYPLANHIPDPRSAQREFPGVMLVIGVESTNAF